ncbi:MAG: rod shape-determining protein MreC, partial [Parcubacteria group bacterium]|nr:rod shape-determining protein MreC [Parcubacteria group bacterium]
MLKLSQNKKFLFLVSLVIVVILVTFHFIGILNPVENVLLRILTPVKSVSFSTGDRVSGFFSFLGSIRDLSRENKSIRIELEKSLVDRARLEELEKENNSLREQLAYKQKSTLELIPAKVIGKDSNNLSNTINVNKGSKDGVEKDKFVIISDGILIGKVKEAYNSYSEVLLISDIYSHIQAHIKDSNADGIVSGEHGLGLIMELIPQDKVIKKGDLVTTSDLEKKSYDLLIGEIEEID